MCTKLVIIPEMPKALYKKLVFLSLYIFIFVKGYFYLKIKYILDNLSVWMESLAKESPLKVSHYTGKFLCTPLCSINIKKFHLIRKDELSK